jgi:hypothetical protein
MMIGTCRRLAASSAVSSCSFLIALSALLGFFSSLLCIMIILLQAKLRKTLF